MITTVGSNYNNLIIWIKLKKKERKKERKMTKNLWIRTLMTYFLNNFPVYYTTALAIVIMRNISLILIYLITGNLYLLTIFLQAIHHCVCVCAPSPLFIHPSVDT